MALSILQQLGMLFLLLAVSVDIFSFYLALANNLRKRGPSGCPILPWLVYFLFSLLWWQEIVFKILAIIIFTTFHICCHYVVPMLHRKWLEYKTR